MKILKNGNNLYPRKFTCHRCKCEFEVTRDEYKLTYDAWEDEVIVCNCPECGKECCSYSIPPKPTWWK